MNRLRQLLFEHNPFYLLSALSMLFGCYTLSNALRMEAGQSWKVLVLLGTLHVYEFLLIGLALFLIRQRAMPRDGAILLRLEVLFLVDATLLNAEAFTADLAAGALVNVACLALAALKLGLILKTLGARLGRLGSIAYGHGLALLIALPGLFTLLARVNALTVQTVSTAWWPLAALIVLLALAERERRSRPALHPAASSLLQTLAIALPTSLALHLVAGAWVHHVPFHVSYLAPVLVGLGLARMLVDVSWIGADWSIRLPVAGVLLSLFAPAQLTVLSPVTWSPFRESLLAAALAYGIGWRVLDRPVFAWAAALSAALAVGGHAPGTIVVNVINLLRALMNGGGRLVPRTAVAWGAIAVASSFALLAAGAWISLFWSQPIAGSGSSRPTSSS
jgi:hypothetical protein